MKKPCVSYGGRLAPCGERGSELIEFALVLPLLLAVVFGIADFGLLFQRYQVITNAAREGARIAVLPLYDDADVTARVDSYLTAGGVPGTATTTFDLTPCVVPSGVIQCKAVIVTYTQPMDFASGVIALLGGTSGPITLQGRATMRLEVPAP